MILRVLGRGSTKTFFDMETETKELHVSIQSIAEEFETLTEAFQELNEIMDDIYDTPEFPPKYIRHKSKIYYKNSCPKYSYIPKCLKNLPYQRRIYS